MKPNRHILYLILLLGPFTLCFTRVFYLDEEFKKSTSVVEIIIKEYTTRTDTIKTSQPIHIFEAINEVSYSLVDNPDIIYKYLPPYTGYINFSAYYHIRPNKNYKATVPEGYWPAKGDTVLVVFDEEKRIQLFADILNQNEYKFWSPYHTSSWNTQFYGKFPFRPDTSEILNQEMYDYIQTRAKNSGYEFASFYHCRVDKIEFWKFYRKIKE